MAELTPKTAGPEFIAHFDGECRRCGRPVEAGEDYVVKVHGVTGIFHPLCAREYCEVVNEHVIDDRDQVHAEQETTAVKARRVRQICRQLHDLDVPAEAIEPVERFAGELDRRAA